MTDLKNSLTHDLQLIASNEPEPDHVFERGPSNILFALIAVDTQLWTHYVNGYHKPVGLQIEEIDYDKGDAAIEADQGMLEFSVYGLLDPAEVSVGWWVMEEFTAHYTRGDGWMTDGDADFYCGGVRRARWSDMQAFGMCKPPLYARILGSLGIDLRVPLSWGA